MNQGNTEQVLQDLFELRTDIAVFAEFDNDARLYAVPYRRDELIAFVPREHPWGQRHSIELEELSGQQMILQLLSGKVSFTSVYCEGLSTTASSRCSCPKYFATTS